MEGQIAVSWGPERIDRFWRGSDRALWHQAWDGATWSEPESLGGTLASAPAATAWAVDQLEVFAVFPDGQLWDRYWDGESWHPWESLGGELVGDPAASSWGADRLDVFARGLDGRTWHRWKEARSAPGAAPLGCPEPVLRVRALLSRLQDSEGAHPRGPRLQGLRTAGDPRPA